MIFISDANGAIKAVAPSTVNQGSNLANRIILFAPFPQPSQVKVAFKLPNGMVTGYNSTKPIKMVGISLENTDLYNTYSAWYYDLQDVVTALKGTVDVQFTIYNGSQTITTTAQSFEVLGGVANLQPEITDNQYDELNQQITQILTIVESFEQKFDETNILKKTDIATINGQSIVNGGNVEIDGLTEEEKAKVDKLVIDGDGTKYLANDGTYKEVAGGSSVTVDSELSTESENPVQNKVITEALNERVKYTDYATTSKAGIVKVNGAYGTQVLGGEILGIARASDVDINARTDNYKPIVPMNLNYAVKKALTEPTVGGTQFPKNWSDEDKAKARATIGATALYKHTITFSIAETGAIIYITYYSYNTDTTFSLSEYPYMFIDEEDVLSPPIVTISGLLNPKTMKLRENSNNNKLQYAMAINEMFSGENVTVDGTSISHSWIAV